MSGGPEMLSFRAEIAPMIDAASGLVTTEDGSVADPSARNSEISRPMVDAYEAIARRDSDPATVPDRHSVEDEFSSVTTAALDSGANAWNGRLAKFVQVAEQNRPQLLWLAQRMTRDRDEAEDIVQEALLRAFKSLSRFRGESQMGTWLGVIVKNAGREWLRNRKGRVCLSLEYARSPDDQPVLLDFPDPGRNPEQWCVCKEMDDILLSEIDGLNSVCKSTMKMCAIAESSHREAARALGVSASAIKSRIFHGKRMLKRAVCVRTGRGHEVLPSLETAL
jgi:RNA polymerase sigma-70 factor (ECF subfamily)